MHAKPTFTKISTIASLSVLTLAGQAFAEEDNSYSKNNREFSGTLGVTSDYTFRGITQNDEDAAIQASLDYALKLDGRNTVYASLWGSQVDFNDNNQAEVELDFSTGIKHDVNDVTLGLGAIYYTYPSAKDSLNYDFYELQASLGYDIGTTEVELSMNYSPDYFGKSGHAEYYKIATSTPVIWEHTITAHIGRQNIQNNIAFGQPDYTDWSFGIAHDFHGIDIKLEYIDTNLSDSDCADGCEGRAVLSANYTIDY